MRFSFKYSFIPQNGVPFAANIVSGLVGRRSMIELIDRVILKNTKRHYWHCFWISKFYLVLFVQAP